MRRVQRAGVDSNVLRTDRPVKNERAALLDVQLALRRSIAVFKQPPPCLLHFFLSFSLGTRPALCSSPSPFLIRLGINSSLSRKNYGAVDQSASANLRIRLRTLGFVVSLNLKESFEKPSAGSVHCGASE